MTVERYSMTSALRTAVCVLAAALAACSVSEGGNVPCADDSSCPSDYPVCQAGKCVAGTPSNSDSIAIVSVGGASVASATPLKGTIHVSVLAKASSGVSSVALTAGSVNATLTTGSGAPLPPLYDFTVDTTQVDSTTPAGAAVTLTAKVTAGDATTATGTATMTVDNVAPTLTPPTTPVPTLKTGSELSVAITASETLDPASIKAIVKSGTTVVANATVAAPASGLSYTVDFGITDVIATGTYTLTVNANDLAGNAATEVDVQFSVQAPVPLTSSNLRITTASGVIEGGLPAGASNTIFGIALSLPAGLTAASDGVAISLIKPGATTPSPLTVTANGASYTTSYTVSVSDPQGIATVQAVVTDVAGNQSSVSGQLYVDKSIPSLAGLSLRPAYVLQTETVTISGSATKPLASATVSASNGDVGTCKCDGVQCNADITASPAVVCVITVTNLASDTPVVATVQLVDLLGNDSPTSGPDAFLYQASYTVVNPATLNSPALVVGKTIITTGSSTTLTPNFSFGQGVITANVGLSPGPVSSDVPISIAPTANTLYTLTVTGAAGNPVSATASVTVVAAPTASIQLHPNQSANVTQGSNVQVDIAFSGAADASHVIVTRSPGSPFSGPFGNGTLTDSSIQQTTVYTITVTNAAGTAATASVTVYVGAAPSIASFCISTNGTSCSISNPTSLAVSTGSTVQLLPNFSNGSGTISRSDSTGVSNATSGVAFSTGVLTASAATTITFALTVTNTAGASASATVAITVIPALNCAGAALAVGAATITNGASTTVTPTIPAGGVGTVDFGSGFVQVASGVAVGVSPTSTTTYTLKVQDLATTPNSCTPVTKTVTVVAPPTLTGANFAVIHPQATLNSSLITAGTAATDTYTFTLPTLAGGTTASITEGPRSYSNSAAILVAGSTLSSVAVQSAAVSAAGSVTFTLTLTNSVGASVSETATIQVIAAPSATAFTASPATVTDGSPTSLSATFSNGTGAVSGNNSFATTAITSGVPHSVVPPSNLTTTFTLTVTNAAGDAAGTTVFGTTRAVQAVAAPTLTGAAFAVTHPQATLNTSLITVGSPATDTYTFTLPTIAGGTASISDGTRTYSNSAAILSVGATLSSIAVQPAAITTPGLLTFTLTITNAVNVSVSETASLQIVAAPTATAFTASLVTVTNGTPTSLGASFSNGSGAVSGTNGFVTTAIASGVPLSVVPPSNLTTKFTLTVTNAAGDAAGTLVYGTTASVIAVPAPTLSGQLFAVSHSSTPTPTNASLITVNSPASDTYTFTLPTIAGGTATISDGTRSYSNSAAILGAGASLASIPVQPAALASPGTLTFTLTITNAVNVSVSETASLIIVAAPTASAFTASPATVTNGTPATFSATFANGAGKISGTSFTPTAISTGVPLSAVPPPGATTAGVTTVFTLTVTNPAGDSAGTLAYGTTASVTAVPAPTLSGSLFAVSHPAATLNTSQITAGTLATDSYTFTLPTIALGTTATIAEGGRNYSTSAAIIAAPGGSLSSIAVQPAAVSSVGTVTFTLTLTNAASTPASVSETATIQVVAAPTNSAFAAAPLTVTDGTPTTFTATFANGIGVVTTPTPTSTAIASGVGLSIIPPSDATTVYTLKVTNSAGDPKGIISSLPNVSVVAVAAPTESSFAITSVSGATNNTISGGNAITTGGAPIPTFTWSVTSAGGCSTVGNCTISCVAGSGGSCGSPGTDRAVSSDSLSRAFGNSVSGPVTFTLNVKNLAGTSLANSPSVTLTTQSAPTSSSFVIQSVSGATNTTLSGGNAITFGGSPVPTFAWIASSSGGCNTVGNCTITCAAGSGGNCGVASTPVPSDAGTVVWGAPTPTAVTGLVTFTLNLKNQAGAPNAGAPTVTLTLAAPAAIASGSVAFGGPTIVPDGTAPAFTLPTFNAATTSAFIQVSGVNVTADIHTASSPFTLTTSPVGTTVYTLIGMNAAGAQITLATATVHVASSESGDSLPTALYGAAAAVIGDNGSSNANKNKILITGGATSSFGGTGATPAGSATAYIYDPATGSITTLATTMHNARAFHTATALIGANAGKVFLAGGNASPSGSSFEIYDDATGSFTNVGTNTDLLCLHGAVALDASNVGVFGGTACNAANNGGKNVYIVKTDGTTTVLSSAGHQLTVGRAAPAVALLGATGQVLIAGGYANGTGSAASSTDLFTYNAATPASSAVAAGPALSAARYGATATLYSLATCDGTVANGDCLVLVAGGSSVTSHADIVTYHLGAATAATTAGSMRQRLFHAATFVPISPAGLVVLSGGVIGGATTNSVEAFDPSTGQFYSAAPMAFAREQFSSPSTLVNTVPTVTEAGGATANNGLPGSPTVIEVETITP